MMSLNFLNKTPGNIDYRDKIEILREGDKMKITENVYLIRNYFNVTPTVERYVNIYLIVGKEKCYLIDSGVAGAQNLVEEYLDNLGKCLTNLGGIFVTHSHPDHIGAAAEIKRKSGCKIYVPFLEKDWIEDIDKQFRERPIPNFYSLLPDSVEIDRTLSDGDVIKLEEDLIIKAHLTNGHSHGSISFLLNDEILFMGDAIPAPNDLPIFTDYNASIHTMDKIQGMAKVKFFCPAWDEVYTKDKLDAIVKDSKNLLFNMKDAAIKIFGEEKDAPMEEKVQQVLKITGMQQYAGNPLVAKSILSCIE